ncbi:MAG: hypothetical protein KGI08_08420, partial [Thaumarchaeota archaeon]|nr:hypothetical protein [Nitrososphaerota archaeon]
ALTLSAWIKPDYSQGSSQFTVISKSNTFILAVNNNMPPVKKVFFSIFDGIKWDTVTSNSAIPQDWTHIAATFNDTTITIYVNGKQEASQQLSGVPTIALNGQLETKTVDSLSSNADVLIGAYLGSRNTASNLFSGLIENVKLYDSLLSPLQIAQIYQNNPLSQNTQINASIISNSTKLTNLNPTINSTIVQNVNLKNSTNSLSFNQFSNATSVLNGTSILNSTSLVNGTSLNDTSANDTAIPVTTSLVNTKNSYLITENPEFKFEYFTAADLKKFKKDIKESLGSVQNNAWAGKEGKIKIDIIGPNGKKIPLKSVFQKLRDGKFDIKLSSLKGANPGLYKVIVTLTRNGQTFTTQNQFFWGLVSLNTEKSIYRPGETANFIIVVLDNGGHSVCNSNISMNIVDPSGNPTTLSTGNGVTPESQCGLYDASYATTSEGNYTVGISATNPSGTAVFNTSFLAENSYPFDIIRTADSKIDPVDNPNSFNVKLDITSFTNASSATIQETVPSVFYVTTDGVVQTVGDTTTITWNKNLIGNSTSVQYTYSVPLQYPQLYALGPAQISYGSGQVFKEARPWFVAVDPSTGTIALNGAVQTTCKGTASGPSHQLSCSGGTGITVPASGSNTLLLVIVSTASGTVSSVKWNAVAMTAGPALANTGQVSMWYMKAPTTGAKTLLITASGNVVMQAGAYALTGVLQATPVGASKNTATGTSGTITTSLTNTNLNSMVVDGVVEVTTTAVSPTSPTQTSGYSTNAGTTAAGASSYHLNTQPASTSTTFQWTAGTTGDKWAEVALEINSANQINTVTLQETLSSSDAVSRIPAKTLKETLSSSDAVSRIPAKTLKETLSSSDAVSRIPAKILSETLSSSD